jgi:hypothetical protein
VRHDFFNRKIFVLKLRQPISKRTTGILRLSARALTTFNSAAGTLGYCFSAPMPSR